MIKLITLRFRQIHQFILQLEYSHLNEKHQQKGDNSLFFHLCISSMSTGSVSNMNSKYRSSCLNFFFHACVLSHFSALPLATLGTITHQALLPMGFSRKVYWSGLPFPPPGTLPDPGIQPVSFTSPALGGGFFTTIASCHGFLSQFSAKNNKLILNFMLLFKGPKLKQSWNIKKIGGLTLPNFKI